MVRRPADSLPRLVCLDCGTVFRVSWLMQLLGLTRRCPRCGATEVSPLRY